MRLSGVDPGIIRELSGIYKPFVKAFKELISNAHDADAGKITVSLSEDFSAIEVLDDGLGMTPFQFHQEFARLGGSTAWRRGGKSPAGRPRIGYKGIGFLAVARYCSELQVETRARRPYRATETLARRGRKLIPFADFVGDLVPPQLLDGNVRVRAVTAFVGERDVQLRAGIDYRIEPSCIRLVTARALGSGLMVSFELNCRDIILNASLNFDHLLSLEHRADLGTLDDFCHVELRPATAAGASYTKVRLHRLKDFVVRELSAPAAKGKAARNIAFKSGKDQFLWRLARSAPIRDDLPPETKFSAPIKGTVTHQAQCDLAEVIVKWRAEEPEVLRRPVYLTRARGADLDDTTIPVLIREKGLHVIGYLLAGNEVIFPAECRGIAIRVRNVMIGDASFLGWEHILSGPRKAAMSQVTGELLVLEGFDAGDAINPGRESFYDENEHYRTLRRALFGSEENIGGVVGQAIRAILDRIRVRSQVSDKLMEARQRRKTLTDISGAVSYYGRPHLAAGEGMTAFFQEPARSNGLATARDVPLLPTQKLGGFALENHAGLSSECEIDFQKRRVRFDFQQDTWSTTIYLNSTYYEVVFKYGKPDHPICEFDHDRRKIFVNWAHPVKVHMDDVSFLKSAILLRLAHHAAPNDANAMMDLALNMLAFRAE